MSRNFFRTPAGIAAVAAVVVLGVGLRVGNLGNVASRSPDERVYTRQAKVVLENGADGLRGLVGEYLRDPDFRFYPPPTRAGYIRLLTAVMRISGTTDERAGAYLSCAASIGSLALLLLLGVRFFPAPAALAAALFFAVSPMELALARRTWQDALVEFLGFSLVYLAAEISRDASGASGSSRTWSSGASGSSLRSSRWSRTPSSRCGSSMSSSSSGET